MVDTCLLSTKCIPRLTLGFVGYSELKGAGPIIGRHDTCLPSTKLFTGRGPCLPVYQVSGARRPQAGVGRQRAPMSTSLVSTGRHYVYRRSEGVCPRHGLFHSCVRRRVAGGGQLPGVGCATRVCRRAAPRRAARQQGSVFSEVRFRGRGPHGCVLLIEIYKMSHRNYG